MTSEDAAATIDGSDARLHAALAGAMRIGLAS
jgi:hypothetical protein